MKKWFQLGRAKSVETTIISTAPKTVSPFVRQNPIVSVAVLAVQGLSMFATGTGAVVAAVLGKMFLAVILGGVAVGISLRLFGRKHRTAVQPKAHGSIGLLCAVVATTTTALVVESINIPIRAHQAGYQLGNWLIVAGIFAIAWWATLWVVRTILSMRK